MGHVKSDHRMQRNYLKGFIGDEINLLLAAAAFNFKKWMNHFLSLLFLVRIVLVGSILCSMDDKERRRHAGVCVIFFRAPLTIGDTHNLSSFCLG